MVNGEEAKAKMFLVLMCLAAGCTVHVQHAE